jgi:NAD-dependent deacetylase
MTTTSDDIARLRSWIEATPPHRMVFFGGAGVSTESGIPDFRSPDGLYSQQYDVPPETLISHAYFEQHPATFFRFYFDRMVARDAQPNRAHRKLAELERAGTVSAVVTQNIDGLHQKAGSENVYELHGSVLRNHCTGCGRAFTLDQTIAAHEQAADGVPRCDACGSIIKPDVVLYGEALDEQVLMQAVSAIRHADLLLVAGTSLVVYPAAGLIDYFSGNHLVIVNKSPTPRDRAADLCIAASIGDALDF